ncbi:MULTISPECIES: chromate transporter [Bacillota]|jgi:chromate transporter|uniref:Chromate transporter n=2 Tax=Amedibacillus TaxID=2749846 RepID=A0A7G9GPS1_9FIRM|nr:MULTISPECIES: chromate transporter [Bacillota]QNM12803.1 chromate transporter [[Eubacterium] hominis]MCH4286682.1 chromate transporter [Amedibacillus hominis]RGB58235.1 chromate transporter [Absiella sp. AM22-9]RGB60008.1 chromate transporter [Absiella sp. AM10-20]RGB65955.1 chromate transporter [Absiella sp. AM09-45]
MIFLQLFWSFLQIGLFSVGGGYAAMPLIQNQVVSIHNWLTMTEFSDIITISQMTPGPIAINSATFVGIQVAGFPGAIVATIGCVFPSIVLMLLLGYLYYKYSDLKIIQGVLQGLRPAVVSLIAAAGISIGILAFWGESGIMLEKTDILAVVIFAVCVFVLRKWKPSPTTVMIVAGVIGGIAYLII